MEKWLIDLGPKPGTHSKRKAEDVPESESPNKRFTKEVSQSSFDWYKQDEVGKWHCSVCRLAKVNGAYARGHDTPAKTTSHTRHSAFLQITRTELKRKEKRKKEEKIKRKKNKKK